MWKRDSDVRPAAGGRDHQAGTTSSSTPTTPSASPQAARPEADKRPMTKDDIVNIGKSVVIKGELSGSEDLTIEGSVDGKIELREHLLTIGSHGKIKAEIFAKSVVVLGEVTGNIMATEKVDIRENGSVDGDIVSPRVAIAEGAHFRGSVDMQRKVVAAATAAASKAEAKPAPPPAPPAAPAGGAKVAGV
jgi:cytoskeletal protein CcmA (bactofilin family)